MRATDLNDDEKAMLDEADELAKQADELKSQAMAKRDERLRAVPLADRLVYASHSRCPCGAGLAYDPVAPEDPNSPFRGRLGGAWDCSAVMLGTADKTAKHTDRLPFCFYEIKSEGQPSAYGATTRPQPTEAATCPT